MLYAILYDLLTVRTVVLSQKNNTVTYLLTWTPPLQKMRGVRGSGLQTAFCPPLVTIRDEHGSRMKAILSGSRLDRTAIFLKIGGSGLDQTEKIFVVLILLFVICKIYE